jgi:hypothetical protein
LKNSLFYYNFTEQNCAEFMKKKNIVLATLFILALALLTACDLLDECGTCELVTDDNGQVTYGTPLPVCGDQLKEKQDASPVTVGGVTTYWNCY